jgi:hypothetical protein
MNSTDRRKRLIRAGGISIGAAILLFILHIILWEFGINTTNVLVESLFLGLLGVGVVLLVTGLFTKPQVAATAESKTTSPAPKPEEELAAKNCPSCGGQNPGENNFCEQCGHKL